MADYYFDETGNMFTEPGPGRTQQSFSAETGQSGPPAVPASAYGNPAVPESVGVDPAMTTSGQLPIPPAPTRDQFEDEAAFISAKNRRLRMLGVEEYGGRAATPAMDVELGRTVKEGIPDEFGPQRRDLADWAIDNEISREAIGLQENELNRAFAQEQVLQAEERVARKQQQLAQIDADVSRQRLELDEAMQRQRELVDKGIDPWAAYSGSGSSAGGRISAALTMMAAAGASPQMYQMVTGQINHIINQEVENQKYAIQIAGTEANNAYSRLMDTYGSQGQAEAALKTLMLDQAKSDLASLVLQTADHQTMMRTQDAMLAIEKELLAEDQKFTALAHDAATVKIKHLPATAGSSGGMRWVGHDAFGKQRQVDASTAKTSADTMEKYQKTLGAGQVDPADAAVEGLDGRTKEAWANNAEFIASIDKFVRKYGIAKGFDKNTGELIGVKTGAMEDKIPGKGIVDAPLASMFPEWDTEGRQVQRDLDQITMSFGQAKSGLSMPEEQYQRMNKAIGGVREADVISGLQGALTAAVNAQKGLAVRSGAAATRGMKERIRREVPDYISPTQLGGTVR